MARPRRLDADRLAAAYERDARRLLVFFTRRTYDAQLAVDLVGETYARAFELRRRFNGDPRDADALAGWVFGIGRNVLNEALRRGHAERRAMRRAGVQAPALDGEELMRIEELAALGELRSAVAAALADLAAEQRDAVRLRVVEELDYAQVAGRLGISEQAARARVSRGLRAIAAALDELAPTEAMT
ncbi:MAG TPA: RNA polymerase sigma factor [Solirubrobacteraceae bacterium]|nr:RNA polymerase sigma factor [Solirubrobacteraceae bacterium]